MAQTLSRDFGRGVRMRRDRLLRDLSYDCEVPRRLARLGMTRKALRPLDERPPVFDNLTNLDSLAR